MNSVMIMVTIKTGCEKNIFIFSNDEDIPIRCQLMVIIIWEIFIHPLSTYILDIGIRYFQWA